MIRLQEWFQHSAARACVAAGLMVSLIFTTGCPSDQSRNAGSTDGVAAPQGRAFASPQEGAAALIAALRPLNADALRDILGPGSDEVVSSGDDVADQHAAEEFVAKYERRHDIIIKDNLATIVVGEDDWPLPIPLVSSGGSWRFDTDAGEDEILARRIGRNELSAIETCRAIVDAQRDYSAMATKGTNGEHAYAQKFASDPGQHNGLYWEAKPGEPLSPLGPAVVNAVAEGYGRKQKTSEGPRPFHGYCFRMLTAQGKAAPGGARSYLVNGQMTGGFAVVAWPIEYGNSGIMSFMVSNRGVVYQKDLGEKTASLAADMKEFDPGTGWEIVR